MLLKIRVQMKSIIKGVIPKRIYFQSLNLIPCVIESIPPKNAVGILIIDKIPDNDGISGIEKYILLISTGIINGDIIDNNKMSAAPFDKQALNQ